MRGVVASVARTLGFHTATFVFALVLGAVFCLSGSTLPLFVVCLFVGSLRSARKLTRFLWRTEMKLNALVEDEGERPVLVRRRSSNSRGQDVQTEAEVQRGPTEGEVTLPVMLLSLLYFLVFKWILDLVFSALPLALWVGSIAQLVPADSALGSMSVVANGTTAAQIFTALAFAFLAHQLGVTSARGLLFVSRNVSRMLFAGGVSGDEEQQDSLPQQGNIFAGVTADSRASSSYGTMSSEETAKKRPSGERSAVEKETPSAETMARNLYQKRRSTHEAGPDEDVKQHDTRFDGAELPYVAPMMRFPMPPMPPPGQERCIEAKERDRYAKEIDRAADEAFHVAQGQPRMDSVSHSLLPSAPSAPHASALAPVMRPAPAISTRSQRFHGDPRTRSLSSRRLSIQTDQELRSARNGSEMFDTVEHHEREDNRSVSIAQVSQASSTHDISDYEIHRFGNISRSYDDDDVTNMRAYAPLSFTESPPQYITALDTGPVYRGPAEQPDYDSFSPPGSPQSIGTDHDSFLDTAHDYDALSPTNSVHDADFSTEKLQQVYRSIQSVAWHQPRHTASPQVAEEGGLDVESGFGGVAGRRDRVNFSAFAPPSVCPSPKPFQFTVWAFLLNQRDEMQERAKSDRPESRKLSLETKLNVRRGALVHVTLEAPTGFRVLNGATQGFSWEGELCNVEYDVECTDGAAFGRVLFKARITVGSSVAVLNSFVMVGSRALDPSELEANVLEGWMDVMEQTYREIPYRSLEMKELVGQGYFGDAYRASLDGEDVVVKTIRASEFGETTSQIVREFQHEAAMLNMFGHHPCIVPFVGASTDTKFPLALVTKYLPYGSMEDNLRGANGCSLSVDERTGMLKDAAAGLLNIHEGGFIHRDLAARNCLVDEGLHVRICDFGLCRRVRSQTFGMLMKDAVGPVKYMAPESLQPPHAFSYDSDVYMFGVLMWEAYTGSSPFASLTAVDAMMRVLRGERLPVPQEIPTSLQTLMQSCFHDSPAERPSMQEVLVALEGSLGESRRASAVIGARTAIATATAAAATNTALAKSISSRAKQDRSIWV